MVKLAACSAMQQHILCIRECVSKPSVLPVSKMNIMVTLLTITHVCSLSSIPVHSLVELQCENSHLSS